MKPTTHLNAFLVSTMLCAGSTYLMASPDDPAQIMQLQDVTYGRIAGIVGAKDGVAIEPCEEFRDEGIVGELFRAAGPSRIGVFIFRYQGKEYPMCDKESLAYFISLNSSLLTERDLSVMLSLFLINESNEVLGAIGGSCSGERINRYMGGNEKNPDVLRAIIDRGVDLKRANDGIWTIEFSVMTWRGSILEIHASGQWSPFLVAEFSTKETKPAGSYSFPYLGNQRPQ